MIRKRTVVHIALLTCLAIAASGCCCAQWQKHWHDAEVAPEVAKKPFWSKDCKPLEEPEPQPVPAAAPATECGLFINSQTYPESQVVRIEKNMPDEVQVNSEFDYLIIVTNVSDKPLDNVTLTERIGDNFGYVNSDPAARQDGDKLVWSLGTIEAGQTRDIRVRGRAGGTDCIRQCATVTYDIPTCGFVRVVNPQLKVSLSAPERVLRCEDIPLTYTVTNTGTGNATDVTLTSNLPEGLQTSDGQRQVQIAIGTLAPGASQEYTVTAQAQKAGAFETLAQSQAEGDLRAQSNTVSVKVIEPVLQLSFNGPSQQYLNRPVRLKLNARNTGSGPAMNTIAEVNLPQGATNITPSDNGQVSGSRVVWELGTLAANDTRELTVSYTAGRADDYTSSAVVSAFCAPAQSAELKTSITGIAGILLEVIDTADPVEVGQEETYLVTVTNQGTAPDKNIRIRAELEPSMEYVSSSGPTEVAEKDGMVTFQPLAELQPGESVTWTIVIRGINAADARFKATMTSEQLGRDVHETEATHFYTTE